MLKLQSQRRQCRRMFSNYRTIALISHNSKVMLKILQTRLQQYVNQGLPDVQAVFRKGRGTREQIANFVWITEKAKELQKNTYFCFTDYVKTFDCVDHNKLWKILKEMGIQDHLTTLPYLNCGVQISLKRRLLRAPWTSRRSNQSIPKEINPEY